MSSSCHEMAFFTPNNFILHSPPDSHHHHNPNSPLNPMLPSCDNFPAAGVAAFLGKRTSMSFEEMNGGDQDEVLSDDGSQAGEKKRRLNMEQVKTLEKNFELGNKLEPERKMQLARALGLQPRQIAIWFQNRRARWKTKQLEKDYDLLKRQFDAIKADNDNLHAQNRKLQAEIMGLKSRDHEAVELINLNKETAEAAGSSSSNRSSDENKRSSELVMEMENSKSNNEGGGLCVESSNYPRSIALFPPAAGHGSCSSMRRHLFHHTSSSASLLVPNSNSNNNNIDINNDDDNNNIISNNNSNNNQMVMKEENLISNMFCGIEDQSGFWPWLEHQHFN